MTSRTDRIAAILRRPQLVRAPLGFELRGSVVQLLAPGTTDPTWTATPEVLAAAIDGALQKDTSPGSSMPGGAEFTARAEILAVLTDAGYNAAAAAELLGRAHREPQAEPPDSEAVETLAGGHALIIQHGDRELIGSCQCGRALGRITPAGSVDHLAGLWERHTTTELTATARPNGAT
jgi:hypothetical protein